MQNTTPLVCVCIPVYNGGKTIESTLQSAISQNYSNYEIVVCDNMSTDNTVEIVHKIASKNNVKITLITNSTKGSAEENWNYLLANLPSEAEFIALYHADDIYHADILKEEVQFIENNNLKAAFTLCKLIDENDVDITAERNYKSELPELAKSNIFRFDELFKLILRYRNFIITPTFMFRTELKEKITPFFDYNNSKSASDLDTWLRISKQFEIGIVPKVLQNYRISKTQGSYIFKQGRTEPADFFRVIDSHLNLIEDKNKFSTELKYYFTLKSIDLIICAVNLLKQKKDKEAKERLKSALETTNFQALRTFKNLKIHSYALAMSILLTIGLKSICFKISEKIYIAP